MRCAYTREGTLMPLSPRDGWSTWCSEAVRVHAVVAWEHKGGSTRQWGNTHDLRPSTITPVESRAGGSTCDARTHVRAHSCH